MKDGFVADSSVGVAWAAPSQSSALAVDLLEQVASGTPFVVPVLWMFEVANALVALARRKRIRLEEATRGRVALGCLNPVVDEEGVRLALGKTSALADEHGLSVYDAAYLELALRRRLPLASLDRALNEAARRAGARTLL